MLRARANGETFVSATMCPQQCVLVSQGLNFVQKHFVSATNVFQFAQPKKHHRQQCVLVYQGLTCNINTEMHSTLIS